MCCFEKNRHANIFFRDCTHTLLGRFPGDDPEVSKSVIQVESHLVPSEKKGNCRVFDRS